ncbi:uncharacterized protein [Haliotis asinina]|uniref:uncharacterized protein isoform X2 n=1 Tax=Haliotis asinina TaxID=109174 RepID=UPI0035327943
MPQVMDTHFNGVKVRIYCPKRVNTASPALIYFHSGGWTFGSIASQVWWSSGRGQPTTRSFGATVTKMGKHQTVGSLVILEAAKQATLLKVAYPDRKQEKKADSDKEVETKKRKLANPNKATEPTKKAPKISETEKKAQIRAHEKMVDYS